MAAQATELWEILVPCQYNNGKPVRTRHHREWDKRVRQIAGGLTIMKPARGQWVHHGALFEERMIPVRIACDLVQISRIARITLLHYKQLAVMVYKVSDFCLVVE